jgi:polysaccharide export outer membrane protein
MTMPQITKKLEKLYSKYIKQPHIMCNILYYNSSFYYITGGISKPGKYKISLNTNLLEALTKITPIIKSMEIQTIYMKRKNKVLPISLGEITKNDIDFSKIHLENGDIFFIPYSSQNRAYILGEIKKPGAYLLQSSYTLLDIISDAGGILPVSANKGAIYLVREIRGKQFIAKIDFNKLFSGKTINIRLKSGDRILVSSTILTDYNRIIEQLLPTTQLIKDSLNIFNSLK